MPESRLETITLGGGCFWCLEAAYQQLRGVTEVVSGYAGGSVPNPSYEAVCTGKTGHAEVVQISFDPEIISTESILEVFWSIHNPTTRDRQGYDVGNEYRSIILTNSEAQAEVVARGKEAAQKLWDEPIVTEIKPLEAFYRAEDYHQNYFKSNPERAYCQIIINPKLAHLREQFADRLRS